MSKYLVLDESDKKILQDLIAQSKQRLVNTPKYDSETVDQKDSRTAYVVKTPVGGLPARVGLVLGFADCLVYRITEEDTLEDIETEFTVYNLSLSAIAADTLILVKKDTWGRLIAEQPQNRHTYYTWSAHKDNYVLIDADVWMILVTNAVGTSSDPLRLSGLTGGTDARPLRITNKGPSDLKITHQDALSTAANRIITPDALDYVLAPGESCDLQYDGTTSPGVSRWRVIDRGSAVCAAITVKETDIQCIFGVLKLYNRTITINIVNGCLTKTTGAWVFVSDEGCCICPPETGTGPELDTGTGTVFGGTGTGTGTDTQRPVITECCPDGLPVVIYATFTGSMSSVGTVALTWTGTLWGGSTLICGGGGSLTMNIECQSGNLIMTLANASPTTFSLEISSCTPLNASGSGTTTGTCAGEFTVVVTE